MNTYMMCLLRVIWKERIPPGAAGVAVESSVPGKAETTYFNREGMEQESRGGRVEPLIQVETRVYRLMTSTDTNWA